MSGARELGLCGSRSPKATTVFFFFFNLIFYLNLIFSFGHVGFHSGYYLL